MSSEFRRGRMHGNGKHSLNFPIPAKTFTTSSLCFEEEFLSTDESYISNREEQEFWNSFYEDMKTWESNDMRENDERVYKAIIVLFESKDDIEIFNKKAIYLYLREITGLNTKQIVNSLKKFKKKYHYFTQNWNNGAL